MNLKTQIYFSLIIFSFSFNAVSQTCQNAIPESTSASQFTVNGDGTVTDNKTGLMWKQCSEGQIWTNNSCSGTASTYTWQAALQIPQTLNAQGGYAGHTDWRLPNIKELRSIVEEKCYGPAINLTVFPGTVFPGTPAAEFWSSSPDANSSGDAWIVDFYEGTSNGSYYRGDSAVRVRLVRSGQ